MATIADITVYNELLSEKLEEVIAQNIDVFNQQSGIVIEGRTLGGSFLNQDFVNVIDGLKYRDVNSTADAVSTSYKISNVIQAKIARYGSIELPIAILEWKGGDVTDEVGMAIINIGTQLANALIQDQLNTGILAAVAAISSETDAIFDADAVLDINAVNDTRALFGDAESMLQTVIMHSGAYNALRKAGMEKNDVLYEAGQLKVATSIDMGVKVIVTDCATLLFDDAGTAKYRILTLVDGGVKVTQAVETVNSEMDLSKVNNTSVTKYETSYFIAVKGTSIDGISAASPSDVILATSTNWTRVASSVKGTAGTVGEFLVVAAA